VTTAIVMTSIAWKFDRSLRDAAPAAQTFVGVRVPVAPTRSS
jgi:hypothetical protein